MATGELLEILLKHDAWATGEILGACEKLTEEEFGRGFEMGPGSLRATLTHMVAAMNAWSDTLAERAGRVRVDEGGGKYSVGELRKIHEEAVKEFGGLARGRGLEEVVKRERGGKVHAYTRGAVIAHVATHGMHHRAQCLNMLRRLGVKELPASSVTEWSRLGAG